MVFDRRRPLPLAIGTSSAVAAALGEVDGLALGIFFRRWTTRWAYLKALAADGSMRHALDGRAIELVSDEHRRHAAGRLAAMREADRRPVAGDKPKPKPVQPEASVAPPSAPPPAVSTRNAALPVLRLHGARP